MEASDAIEVRAHPSIRAFPEATWDALDGVHDAPFLSHAWLDTLETTGCVGAHAGWQPHHLGFWQGERLLAAAPAYLKDNSEGEFVFDWAWASAAERARIPYYPKLVVAVPFTPATAARLLVADPADRPRLLPALAEALRVIVREEEISSAHVLFPTANEATGLAAAGLAHRHGVQFHWRNAGYGSFDDFLARFSSKRRNQIRREVREMTKQGIEIVTERGRIEPEIIDAMFGFYTATVDKFTWGRQYLNRAFFEEICQRLAGKVEIVIAREGGKIIAGAFNLRGEGALFGRYWGASVERPFLHFNVCFYHSIEACIAEKIARFEPGAGGQHKLVRGFEPAITHSAHHLAHPGLDRAVREFLEREREAVAQSVADAEVAWK
jgi:uncharacterized protein